MRHFGVSFLVSALCLVVAGWWGFQRAGWSGMLAAFWITLILGVLEVSLSFDNAVVNASVLRSWNRLWQTLFLTIGILVAVFGMRLLFPLLIVSQATGLGIVEVWRMAIATPNEYSRHLTNHYAEVAAFGGMFLLLVFLNFVLDRDKEVHWIGWLEEKLAILGRIDSVAVLVALLTLLATLNLVPEAKLLPVLLAGLWGIVIYVAVKVISGFLAQEEDSSGVGEAIKRGGIGGFLYLEVLDASFSFDGVIGAFAITKDVVIIMLGLGIGAMFVRSTTIYLVRKGTLDEYVFLEHGAHYAIGVLAAIMLVSVKVHIPELITGLVGVAFIVAALWSSIRHKRMQALKAEMVETSD